MGGVVGGVVQVVEVDWEVGEVGEVGVDVGVQEVGGDEVVGVGVQVGVVGVGVGVDGGGGVLRKKLQLMEWAHRRGETKITYPSKVVIKQFQMNTYMKLFSYLDYTVFCSYLQQSWTLFYVSCDFLNHLFKLKTITFPQIITYSLQSLAFSF